MLTFDLPAWLVLVTLFCLGACVGSFLNVVVYRLPQHATVLGGWASLFSPPSRCPYCGHDIRWYHNLPIVGWIWLRGRCYDCRHSVSWRYPAIELINGLIWCGLYWLIVPTDATGQWEVSCLWTPFGATPPFSDGRNAASLWATGRYVYFLIFVECLLVASLIDFDLMVLPDSITLPGIAAGVIGAAILGDAWLAPLWLEDTGLVQSVWSLLELAFTGAATELPPFDEQASLVPAWVTSLGRWQGLISSIVGALAGAIMIWCVRALGGWLLREEAMGDGDIFLMAVIGSFMGWQACAIVFFLAPGCALFVVVVTWFWLRDRAIPYGPYLSLAAVITLCLWSSVFGELYRLFALGPVLFLLAGLMLVFLAAALWLTFTVKRLLGLVGDDSSDELAGDWTSADQLAFFAGKLLDPPPRPLRGPQWPGETSGRGLAQYQVWRGQPRR